LLAECLQGFEGYAGEAVRQYGSTHAQFDMIATLGNTSGMPNAGDAVFRAGFSKVVAHGKQLFEDVSDAESDAVDGALKKLRERIRGAGRPSSSSTK